MEFSIGRLYVKIEIKECSPFQMSKRAKRRLAEMVLAEVKPATYFCGNSKILRIKTLRLIGMDEGWYGRYGFGLRAAKDWVEEVFADNGAGEIAL